jgi:hypothetical protein
VQVLFPALHLMVHQAHMHKLNSAQVLWLLRDKSYQAQMKGADVLRRAQVLLPALHRMVYQAHRDKLSGAQLLRMLHDKSSCGVPTLQSCCQRLLWHCNQILLSHIRSWWVHISPY